MSMYFMAGIKDIKEGIEKAERANKVRQVHREFMKLLTEKLRLELEGKQIPPQLEERKKELEEMKKIHYNLNEINKILEDAKRSQNLKELYQNTLFFYSASPSSVVLLVLPANSVVKYIDAASASGGRVVAALPLSYHLDIVEFLEGFLGTKLSGIKGGKIRVEGEPSSPKLFLFESSQKYGKADHSDVASLLKAQGFPTRHE